MRSKFKRVAILLLCVVPLTFWSYEIRNHFQGPVKTADFSTIYFGARCAIHGKDPYDRAAFLRELAVDGVSFADGSGVPWGEINNFVRCVYLPTALFAVIPFALLPWGMALNLFMILTAGFLALAGLLVWDLGGEFSPVASGCMTCFIVANCMLLLLLGNPAGVVASFCVIAAWCLLRKRYEIPGVLLLALSLVVKPHDAGFVWLYFLLAGGTGRKRALQSLAVAAVLGICATAWILPVSPRWMQELHGNLAGFTAPGGFDDPGPSGPSYKTVYPDVSLAASISIFRNEPSFYNPLAGLIGGGLILAWGVATLRKRTTQEGALLAVAAISILTLLPVYHRTYDTKLLLLTIPACAVLWAKGPKRWVALALTSAIILVTSDVPLMILDSATHGLTVSASTLGGKLTLLLLQPAPLVLLAAGCFYLWIYLRYKPPAAGAAECDEAAGRTAKTAAT